MSAPMDVSTRKRPLPQEFREQAFAKWPRHNAAANIPGGTVNVIPNAIVEGSNSTASLISSCATLLAQGERGAPSVQILMNSLTPDMLAEIVIANMVHLPSPRDPRATLYLHQNDRSVAKQEPVRVESIKITHPACPLLPFPQPLAKRVLSGSQTGALCEASLVRILQNHNTDGGGELRNALLARVVAEFTEALQVLESHILADYEARQGHELGLHVLYQLYADHPTVYDQFLLSLAQGLRDKISPTDKSLIRLLSEVPVVSTTALKLVEELCVSSKAEHVTTGLTTLWSLILQRPPVRDTCLKVVLKCTVHESDITRGKAVRLVANKLYPLHYVTQSIEDFATRSFYSVVKRDSVVEDQQTSDVVAPIADGEAKSSHVEVSLPEAQQHMSLLFALCTKKHALLQELFQVYGKAPKAVKQAIDNHITILVRTIGSSSQELLQLIADPPAGSDNLVKQVQMVLSTDGIEIFL